MEDNFFEMPIDMNKSLAEIMDSTDKSRIFLTSDWHVMKYKYQKGRNYVNTNEIVKWCKDNIKSNDIFIYLGDLCYRYANKEDSKKAQEIYKSLPGIKVLILGNHDIHQGEDFYNNCGFDYVFTEFEYHDIVFTHRPINMIMRGNLSGLNIHGHIHELTNDYDFLDPSRNINVYPNNYDNKPTTLKYILNHINKLTKDNKPNNTTDLSDGLTESSRIIRDYLGSQLDDSNIFNEGLDTFLTTNPFKDSVTLYHGSSYQQKQTVIKPEGICAGNRFSSPHMASFWAPTFEYAELFGLFRVIGKELDYYCGFAGDAKHIFVLPQEYSEIERKIKNKVIWVYVKNISKKYINAGHVRYIDEFTIPVDVKPDEAICLKWNDFKELFYDTVIKLPYKDKKDNREFLDKEYKKMQKLDYVPSNLLKLFIHYNMDQTLNKVRDYKKLN